MTNFFYMYNKSSPTQFGWKKKRKKKKEMGLLLGMAQVGQCWAGLSKSWAPHVDNSLDVGMNFEFFQSNL